jgi:signal transduction histidine kinase
MPVAVWEAASRAPARFLLSAWPVRVWAFLIAGIGWGAVVLAALFLPLFLAAIGLWPAAIVVAAASLVVLPLVSGTLMKMEVGRLSLVDSRPLVVTSEREPGEPPLTWLLASLRDRARWRGLGYMVTAGVLAVATGAVPVLLLGLSLMFVAAPVIVWAVAPDTVMLIPGHAVGGPVQALPAALVGLAGVVVSAYIGAAVAGVQAQLARGVLSARDEDLGRRLVELTRSRVRLVDAFAAERRRIERDLHDGAQQQLVALTMTLGLAELELAGTGSEAARLVSRAKAEADQARRQLRELVQGIHEQVLEDHGLPAALEQLAGRSPVPVTLDVAVAGRLGAPVETTAYFTAAEALTNAARHAGATAVSVTARLWETDGTVLLVIEVTDNGQGGADLTAGSGLQGIADRLAVMSGRLLVTSPRGGPTTIRAEIPCRT